MDKPRLAESRLADDIDHAKPAGLGVFPRALQTSEFVGAADQCGEAAADGDIETGHGLVQSVERIDPLLFCFAIYLARGGDKALDQLVSSFAEQDAAGLGRALDPRGEIDGVAKRGDFGPLSVADLADDQGPGVNADAEPWADAVARLDLALKCLKLL